MDRQRQGLCGWSSRGWAKRRVLSLGRAAWIGFAIGVALLSTSTGSAAAATESLNWQVDSAHTGFVYGAGVVPPLRPAWSVNLNMPSMLTAIDAGHVFAVAGAGEGPYDLAQAVDSIDLSTGEVTWSQPINTNQWGTTYLAVDPGTVFTATDYLNYDAATSYPVVSAFDEQTGALRWSTTLPGNEWEPTPPIVSNGVLYIDAEGQGGTVYALRESDGALLWSSAELLGRKLACPCRGHVGDLRRMRPVVRDQPREQEDPLGRLRRLRRRRQADVVV